MTREVLRVLRQSLRYGLHLRSTSLVVLLVLAALGLLLTAAVTVTTPLLLYPVL